MNHSKLFIRFCATKKMDECSYEMKYLVRQGVLATLEYEDLIFSADLSVTFCDNEYIKQLNKTHRGKNSATDVLSFPMFDFNESDPEPNPDGSITLGDIVISLERAAEQAKELGHSLEREVLFLAIHSTLHLLGYDHERSKEDEEAQCLAQREIIEILENKF